MLLAVENAFTFACPACRTGLDQTLQCACGLAFEQDDGVWRFLPPEQAATFRQFETEYLTVRRSEGWGSNDAAYYRALPWRDLSGQFAALWAIRAESFRTVQQLLEGRPAMRVLDLGAGNCWLSYQLARRGHMVAAIDILTDARDGLGARSAYDAQFTTVQAAYDRLPFAPAQADLAIFNGSLHYSTDYVATVREALRVLRPGGLVVIMDSPWYSTDGNGVAMVKERRSRFQQTYGFSSDGLASEHFLTASRLQDVDRHTGVRWRVMWPHRGLGWRVRPWLARLRGHREPARFPVIVGTTS